MVSFHWRGTDARGREQRGECSAGGLVDAAAQVRARGLAPIAVERLDPEPMASFSVTADAFTTFNRTLAEMTSLGVPLARAVGEIASGLRGGRFKNALATVEAALREGRTLDEAVAAVPGVFPPYYQWMLRAGSASGNLPAVLSAVARNTEGLRVARRALVEAVTYPMVIVLAALAFLVGSAVFYLPLFRDFCRASGYQMPASLETLLRVFSSAGALLAIGAGVAVFSAAAWMLLRRTVAGERILRRTPLVGRIRVYLSTARLLGSLGVLLRSSAPLSRALPVAIGASGSLELARAGDRLSARAAEGAGLGEMMSVMPGVPPEIASYLKLAERAGDASHAAGEVAALLTEQATAEGEALFAILMPVALMAAGVFVAAILIPLVTAYIGFVDQLHP
jgi:type IV pilus assembly protein PilC